MSQFRSILKNNHVTPLLLYITLPEKTLPPSMIFTGYICHLISVCPVMLCLPELCAKDLNSCDYRVIISVECWPTGPMSPYLKLQSSHCTYEYMKVLNASFLVRSTPQSASDVFHHPVTHIHLLLVSSHLLIYRDNHSSFIHQRCRM